MDQVVEPVSDPGRRIAATPGRRVAPGGWRRGVVGVALGLLAGVVVATVVPRDRRASADASGPDRRGTGGPAPCGG